MTPKCQFFVKAAQECTFLKQPREAMLIFGQVFGQDFGQTEQQKQQRGRTQESGTRASRAHPFVVAVSAVVSVVQFSAVFSSFHFAQKLDQKSDQTLDQ